MMNEFLKSLIKKSKILKSLKFRIFVLVMIVGIIPCTVMRGCIIYNYEKRAVNVKISDVTNQCKILSNHLYSEDYLDDTSNEVINGELEQLSDLYDGRILIINDSFRIIKDTYAMSDKKTMISKEVIACFNGSGNMSAYDSSNHYIEVTVPIINQSDGTIIGVMLASASTDSIIDSRDILDHRAWIFEITMAILVLVTASMASTFLAQPFSRVTKAISSVKEGFGDESGKISIPDYTETEAIADAFNQLLSRMKVLDDSREEFVSNVSHELKTPLASMKVLADSIRMEENVPVETYKEFMDDIAEEVDRENKIITDLLSLVKLDKTAGTLNIEPTDINQMLEQIMRRLKPIAARAEVELVLESKRNVTAEVDQVKLSLAMMNLVENAIKYNKKNGWVRVTLDADHQFCTMVVSDSGIGIPEDSISHIYERFYRVDKSHSREIGGTGLGLAITRNAILLHRGAIKATSIEGEGTTFTVRIPLTYIS